MAADAVPLPTPAPSPSFWRWLRPSPKVTEKCLASRTEGRPQEKSQPDEMEERLLTLLAGVHQQVVADAQHSEQLATLSRRRSEVRVSALEEQQRRLDIRLNDLSAGLKSIEKAAPAASMSQLHVDLSELRRSVRLVASNQQEACKREDELQEHLYQRLKPLEDRLSALEGEVLIARHPGEKVQAVEALDSEKSFRSFETSNEEPSTIGFPVLMDQNVRQLEKRLEEELEKIHVQIDAFSKSEVEVPLMRALSERIAACEESCRCVDTFVERFTALAAKVQEGFADARGHLDQVLAHIGPRQCPREKDGLEEMRGSLVEVKASLDSLACRLEDLATREHALRAQEVARSGTNEGMSLPKNEGHPLMSGPCVSIEQKIQKSTAPWAELAQLSSALDGFEAAIQQAESSLRCNGT